MLTFGIDVSHWEGTIDWQRAYPTVQFAYYKCTDGISFVDSQFYANRDGCNRYGLAHAPYHWLQPEQSPERQAEHFIEVAGRDYKRYVLDLEDMTTGMVDKVYAFLKKCEALTGGIRPAIYTSASKWNEFMRPYPSWAKDYDLIVANYTARKQPALPVSWSSYKIWQFTDYWWFPGCITNGDGDWFNGTIEQCREWFGNYHPYLPEPQVGQRYRVITPYVNIREAPNVNSKFVGSLNFGDIIVAENVGGGDAWIKHSKGWTCAERYNVHYLEPKND